MKPVVEAFFDTVTNTVTYVVSDPETGDGAVIDPVLDFDPASGRTSTDSADRLIEYVERNQFKVSWILETHAHADHLSAAIYIRSKLGGRIGVGSLITEVQAVFGKIFNLGPEFKANGEQFNVLFSDGDVLKLGDMEIHVLHTPGHTPACVTYLVGNVAFVGDTLFMPDFGTARTDFPGGDAATLYRSIQRLFRLPDTTRLFTCHDYKAPGREEFAWETTVADERAGNIHVHDGVSEKEFVEFRETRDARLGVPRLLLPSIQFNIRAGEMPPAEDNGVVYLKLPVNEL